MRIPMTDLWTNTLSKKNQLKIWLKEKEFAKTSEVVSWGLRNYHIRAERDCRDFAGEGLIRRLTSKEKTFRGFSKSIEDIWVWIKL